MNIEQQIEQKYSEIRALEKALAPVELSFNGDTMYFHYVPSYEEGGNLLRRLGVQKWEKKPYADGSCSVQANLESGLTAYCFCKTLPPTCRLEQYVERIPKTETKETGDFVEIVRTKVVCGSEDGE